MWKGGKEEGRRKKGKEVLFFDAREKTSKNGKKKGGVGAMNLHVEKEGSLPPKETKKSPKKKKRERGEELRKEKGKGRYLTIFLE